MEQLFCLGLGYSATAYIETFGRRFNRVSGSVRDPGQRKSVIGGHNVEVIGFEGAPSPAFAAAVKASSHLLVSAPPASAAAAVTALNIPHGHLTVVYLSSLGVYGDHAGAAIDENAALLGDTGRGRERVEAEEAWRQFGRDTANAVSILRLAGIYGPGRNALETLANGQARRIVKPGQVFNRIHVADIAQVIHAAFERKANGDFNVTDDEPAPPQDVIAYAARLLGRTPPPEEPFETARLSMSPMAQSFYAECKRASNDKMKAALNIELLYPSYREGLDALFAARDHD